jgi:hypothetical protein
MRAKSAFEQVKMYCAIIEGVKGEGETAEDEAEGMRNSAEKSYANA